MLHVLLQVDNLVKELVFVRSLGISFLERELSLFHNCVLEELDRLNDVHSVLGLNLGSKRLSWQRIKLLEGELIVKVEAIAEWKPLKGEGCLANEHTRRHQEVVNELQALVLLWLHELRLLNKVRHSFTILNGQRPIFELLWAWGCDSGLGEVGWHVREPMRAVERDIDVSQRVLVEPFSQGQALKVGPPYVVVNEHLEYVFETAIDGLLIAKHSEALNIRALLDNPL